MQQYFLRLSVLYGPSWCLRLEAYAQRSIPSTAPLGAYAQYPLPTLNAQRRPRPLLSVILPSSPTLARLPHPETHVGLVAFFKA